MNDETVELFTRMNTPIINDDWRKSLDSLFMTIRKNFVFDNLAVYLVDRVGGVPEVVFARAIGRARSKEADVSWGEEIANQVAAADQVITRKPSGVPSTDRNEMPYLLGLPFSLPNGKGVVVFVRFGGPDYTDEQMPWAYLAVAQSVRIFEHRLMRETTAQLELSRRRAQFQDDFIATISHELHTPLGFIKGYTTSLLRSDTNWNIDTQREFLTIIDEESDHLIRLVDHILDSARLQSGNIQMDFQPVRLDSLLRDIVLRVRNRNKTLKIILETDPAPPMKADTVRLTQVIGNLFDNSIKYAPGSKIKISLKAYPEKQLITFADEGPGIPPEHIPYLFERFYRVPGQPNKRGTGLGLYICKQIIQAHQGSITVQTASEKGAHFLIELPVKARKSKKKG